MKHWSWNGFLLVQQAWTHSSPSCWVSARWRNLCCPCTGAQRTRSPSVRWSSLSTHKQHIQLRTNRRCRPHRPTWSKSCLPVVLGRMANSSSASMVVTRTFICQRKDSRWNSGGHVALCQQTCVKEQRSMKATAIFEFVGGGNLVLWRQNDQKEDSLHVSVQPGASNHKRLVGTTIKTRSPHYSLNWVLYTNHKYSPLLSEITAKLQLHAIECPTLLMFSCFLIRKHSCFNIFSCLTWSPNAVISTILSCEVC